MMVDIDEYIKDVIGKGDEGSKLLARITAPTLKNSNLVEIMKQGMNGLAVLRVPEDHYVIVHSAGGHSHTSDLEDHAASMVNRLVYQTEQIGATPVGFANVIDSSTGDNEMLETIANALVERANNYKIAIMNGENAILGNRVNCQANVSGTMISIIRKDIVDERKSIILPGIYAVFDPEGKAVMINSDGVGTKTEFYERAKKYNGAVEDFMAMNLDDASKIGAIAKVISGVIETKGAIPVAEIQKHLVEVAERMGIQGLLSHEDVGERIRGYNDEAASYNISGSVVSVIDESMLNKPLAPKKDEYLIAIRKKNPNPRSNGITGKRKIMTEWLGDNWHETDDGKHFLEYLTEPSVIFYPVFKGLIEKGLATSVYHMSGGAFNGKLARPLAKQGLWVHMSGIFPADERELKIAELSGTDYQDAYQKWPMGNDGFITTRDAYKAMQMIRELNPDLEARFVGSLKEQEKKEIKDRPSVKFMVPGTEKMVQYE